MNRPHILQPSSSYLVQYPKAVEFAVQQASVFWPPEEPDVEKDIHQLRTEVSEAEYHGILTTLKTFTKYELVVGNEYWLGYINKIFNRPADINRMAITFGFWEDAIHAPFYFRINQLLGLDTDEFWNSYLNDEVMTSRMDWLSKIISRKSSIDDILRSIGSFSMTEGAILFSAFGFLKHFNSNGKNKIKNINAGINFSAVDETIHSQAGAWLFRTLLSQSQANVDLGKLRVTLETTARVIREHEHALILKIFEVGPIDGIDADQLIAFVEHRLDVCLQNLGYEPIFNPVCDKIKSWFYLDLESSTLHDFFDATGSDYNRNWDEKKFTWKTNNDSI
jgi:ribonucleoside-diphosphate reductase beta chain